MGRSKFTDKKSGDLVEITLHLEGRKDWAFIPRPLPPEWVMSRKTLGLAAEAMASIAELNGVCGAFLPNPELLLRPLQTREALTSSRIEGTHISAEQFLLLGGGGEDAGEGRGGRDRDWVEVHNYSVALRWGLGEMGTLPVSGRLIKGMHERLMRGAGGEGKTPGEYRRHQVQVGPTGRFIPPPPGGIGDLMANIEEYANADVEDTLAALIRCFVVHYQFEAIHPFIDGNGRTGRALLALMVCDAMKLPMPWLYLSAFFERFKDEYIDTLFAVSARGAWDEWVEFCLQGAIWQAKDSIQRCRNFKRIMDSWHARVADHSPRTSRIIDRLLRDPIITLPTIQREFRVTAPTARRDVGKLVEAGILARVERPKRPQVFIAVELFRAAYLDEDAADQGPPGTAPPAGL